ncbi:MAG: FAD/NAD(P)-binding protein [Candidatus Omnitrophota bacterium]
MQKVGLNESPYIVKQGKIVEAKQLTDLERFFRITLPDGESLDHDPGQFVMVSIPGVGDAPISIASSPTKRKHFDLVVRDAGKLTRVLQTLKAGDSVGIRGPFGKGFPTQVLEGNDIFIVAGGLGIVPLRSLIHYIIDNRRDFGKVHILLGCKCPKDMLFGDELKDWEKRLDINFNCTIDKADPDWKGNVGLITTLIPGVDINPERTMAIVVGPPIMYKFVITKLFDKGIAPKQIYVSLERHMKCGIGKCGHCQIARYYCCTDGPVFSYDQLADIKAV